MQPSDPIDFTRLDDPQFLSARARLRERLQGLQGLQDLPEHHTDRAELQRTHDAMTRKFDRRASRSVSIRWVRDVLNVITSAAGGAGFA